ncbi:hypothetical protein LEP1GSC131_0169 [Leptospira kirschneri str. 200802841]|uniref:Uncharacterized protein n=1 Tax=Leptospira kirschneri str. 200802841 TaxID=1193047 RepID=A0A828Y0S0_9LEPT|nr:hypothetical protein LEP1GSC131_0169 [Leptospira kirschneri str. 200802841]
MDSNQIEVDMQILADMFADLLEEEDHEDRPVVFASVNEILWGNESPAEIMLLLGHFQKGQEDDALVPLRFWVGGRRYFRNLLAHCNFLSRLPKEYTDGFVLCLRTSLQEQGISPLTHENCAILLDSLPCALFSNLNAEITESGFDFIA